MFIYKKLGPPVPKYPMPPCVMIKANVSSISVSGFFMELVSCVRFRVEEPPDERPQTRFTNLYSAHSLVLSVENRDSMALLAAIFTGKYNLDI